MERMDRRSFLKRAGLSAGAVALGGTLWRVGGVWWDQPAAAGYRILSAREVIISDAIAEAIFPGERGVLWPVPSASEVGATRFLDTLLVEMLDELTGNALRLLLHAIDEFAIGSGGSLRRFSSRGLEERITLLSAWDESWLSTRRGAFSALKVLYAMGYCEHPRVLEAMGISYSCQGVIGPEAV